MKSQTRHQQKAEGGVQVQVGLEDVTPSEARMMERNETSQLEELGEISPWEKLEAAMKTEWVQTKGDVRADLGATVCSVARKEEANTPRKTWDKGDSQSMDHTSTSRQGEE